MSRRLEANGFYRKVANYLKIDEVKTNANVVNGNRVAIFEDIPNQITFKYSNGEGFTKQEFNLFQSWVVSSGNAVIETNARHNFQKGEKIIIDGAENIINQVITRVAETKNIRRKRAVGNVSILYIG